MNVNPTALQNYCVRILPRYIGHKIRQSWDTFFHIYAAAPATVSAIIIMWILSITFRHENEALHYFFAINLSDVDDFWHIFSSGLTAYSPTSAVITTIAIAILGAMSERALGTRRFVAYIIAAQVVGTIIGIAVARLVMAFSDYWGLMLSHEIILSPTTWLFGATAVASAAMPIIWRRRIRVFIIAVSVTLFLYAGVLSDFPRLAATLVGIAWGQWFILGNMRRGAISRREGRVLVSTFVFAITIGPFLASLNPNAAGPLSGVVEFVWTPQDLAGIQHIVCSLDPRGVTCVEDGLMADFFHAVWIISTYLFPINMLVICFGLVRGRRLAWVLALFSSVCAIILMSFELVAFAQNIDDGVFIFEACATLFPWVCAILLLIFRASLFDVPLPTLYSFRFVGALVGWFVACSLLWLVFGVPARLGVWSWLSSFLPPVLGTNFSSINIPNTHLGWASYLWPSFFFWLGCAFILWRAFNSVAHPENERRRQQAKVILTQGSGDHLGWMSVWDGNDYWFSADNRGYVAYRVHSGVAVTVGAPVVADSGISVDMVASEFEAYAVAQGWRVSWYSVNSDFAADLAKRGWHQVQVAEESVIRVSEEEDIVFKGKKFQDVRTARNRAEKEGIRTVWTTWSEAEPILRERIIALSEDWVSDKSLPEMGFTLGGLEELKDPDVHLMLAVDDTGHVHGVTSWLPVYENGVVTGWILDFMRRDANGFRPVVEYLIAETIIYAHNNGIQWISLSGAPLAHSTHEDATLLAGVLDRVGALLEPIYGFRSLANFKRKFQPTHQPWFMCYNDELALPSIGMAVGKCYIPNMTPAQWISVAKQLAQR